jgi:hypothetical protein
MLLKLDTLFLLCMGSLLYMLFYAASYGAPALLMRRYLLCCFK